MSYLMALALDNGGRLERTSYVFEYAGIQFKLVQANPRKHADHLLTLLPTGSTEERQRAYAAASDFSAALCWQNGVATAVWETAGTNWPSDMGLRRTRPFARTFPRIPFRGLEVGRTLTTLPTIENDRQKLALNLFREARSSNNEYLSFLFYWHVLEVAGQPEGVADKVYRKHRAKLRLRSSDFAALPVGGRRLGNYLADDCRHAIAHVSTRRANQRRLEFDSIEDRRRMRQSVRVVEELARVCIVELLKLAKESFLVRVPDSTVPRYVDEDLIRAGSVRYAGAYPRLNRAGSFPSPRGGRGRQRATRSGRSREI